MSQSSMQTVSQAIHKALTIGASFFAYRMPGEAHAEFGCQLPGIAHAAENRFVVHPFVATQSSPEVCIHAHLDAEAFVAANHEQSAPLLPITQSSTSLEQYLDMANRCIDALRSSEVDKVVLSRVIVQDAGNRHWGERFVQLANSMPHAFVFVFNTPATGAWMGASPELLLSAHDGKLNTMALAATKAVDNPRSWTEKEIAEQRYVATYIERTFVKLGLNYTKHPTTAMPAGNVQHICTPFSAVCPSNNRQQLLLDALHPTPALAGEPKQKAIETIFGLEQHQRRYYGGYIGPQKADGNFNYFVNLRCMQFTLTQCCIYAGGGLTAQSIAIDEWHETQLKAQPLIAVI